MIDSLGDGSYERALFAHQHVGFVERRLEIATVTLPSDSQLCQRLHVRRPSLTYAFQPGLT
jgi:hypothetical protein